MDMNLSKYMAFVATVEYGSFTKAAETLCYSQSAISRMINDLEAEWKLTVLERGKSGVKLTPDGWKLLPYAKGLCEEYRKLQMQVDELHGMQSGLIRIGTFSSVTIHWLPSILRAFQQDYPNIDFELLQGDYTEIESWIMEGRADCGFLRLPTRPPLVSTFLTTDPLFAILPQGHPLGEQNTVSLASLCHEPFLLAEKGAKSEISALFTKHDLVPKVRLSTWDYHAILAMVEAGLGVSILPALLLQRHPYQVTAKPLDIAASRDIGFALRSQKNASLAVQRFFHYLSSHRPSDVTSWVSGVTDAQL